MLALTQVREIGGTGAAAREDQTIILNKGKIQSVGDASTADVPKEAQALDLHGYSVIPGLVGMHDHMFYPAGNAIFHEMAISFPRLYLAGTRPDPTISSITTSIMITTSNSHASYVGPGEPCRICQPKVIAHCDICHS